MLSVFLVEPSFADCSFCRSLGLLFGRSVGRSYGRSVGRSVGRVLYSPARLSCDRGTLVHRHHYSDTSVSSFALDVRPDRNRLFMSILPEPALASALTSIGKPLSSCRSACRLRLEPYRVGILRSRCTPFLCVRSIRNEACTDECSFKEDIGPTSRKSYSQPAKKEPQSYRVQSCFSHLLRRGYHKVHAAVIHHRCPYRQLSTTCTICDYNRCRIE